MRWLTKLLRRDVAIPLGRRGEQAAARFLKKHGFKIVARGARSRLGELDLVAVDGRTVVFVEVKTWRRARDDSPADAVGPGKQDRLTRAALTFLKAHGLLENASRFDVVSVTWPKHARRPSIEHFPNAFQPRGQGQFFS